MPCPLVGRGNTKMLQNDFNFALLRFLPPDPLKLHPLQLLVRSWWVSGSDGQRLPYLLRYICMGSCYWWLTSLQTGNHFNHFTFSRHHWHPFCSKASGVTTPANHSEEITSRFPYFNFLWPLPNFNFTIFLWEKNTKFSTGFKFTSMWYCTIIHCRRAGTCTGGSGVNC